MSECTSCHAPIIWAVTPRGKRIPLDTAPGPDGIFRLENGVARPVAVGQIPLGDPDLYTTHFATCPDADQHRKPR